MNLIEKWKNRETKKKLREENIRLKWKVENLENLRRTPSVCTIERNVQAVHSEYAVPSYKSDTPEGIIKVRIASNLMDYLMPFIEYDFRDNPHGGKVYTGTLYVATGDRKRESNNEM